MSAPSSGATTHISTVAAERAQGEEPGDAAGKGGAVLSSLPAMAVDDVRLYFQFQGAKHQIQTLAWVLYLARFAV